MGAATVIAAHLGCLDTERVMEKVKSMPNARQALDLLVTMKHFLADVSLPAR